MCVCVCMGPFLKTVILIDVFSDGIPAQTRFSCDYCFNFNLCSQCFNSSYQKRLHKEKCCHDHEAFTEFFLLTNYGVSYWFSLLDDLPKGWDLGMVTGLTKPKPPEADCRKQDNNHLARFSALGLKRLPRKSSHPINKGTDSDCNIFIATVIITGDKYKPCYHEADKTVCLLQWSNTADTMASDSYLSSLFFFVESPDPYPAPLQGYQIINAQSGNRLFEQLRRYSVSCLLLL